MEQPVKNQAVDESPAVLAESSVAANVKEDRRLSDEWGEDMLPSLISLVNGLQD